MLRNVEQKLASFRSTHNSTTRRKPWDPAALRPWNLLLGVVLCWTSIAVLQFYMSKSQDQGGVIFAPRINDLPLSRTFVYQYMPTILAVIFSIFWVWVDIDAKRYQPFHEMSKPEGALGKDALLLHYPFDFIPIVPFFALRRRHWLVFWASTATVLTTFGIVPLQAGIFITRGLTQTFPQSFALSTSYMDASKQEDELTLSYAHSAYGILTLNETFPGYMTRNYTLAPFKSVDANPHTQETWTSETTLYSLDLHCEEAIEGTMEQFNFTSWNSSSTGCGYPSNGPFGNSTIEAITEESMLRPRVKEYSTQFAGFYYYNEEWEGQDDLRALSLDLFCERNDRTRHQFMAAFARNKEKESDPPKKPTSIFCIPSYYQQRVRATIDAASKAPQNVILLDEKTALPPGLFDQELFEFAMYAGARNSSGTTNNLPSKHMPKYYDRLSNRNITNVLESQAGQMLDPISAMALMTEDRDLKDYLDPIVLAQSYENAIRLLFARAMNQILETSDFSSGMRSVDGFKIVKQEAVTLEPVFTYIVEGLLGAVSIAGLGLLFLSCIRKKKLYSDPGTIASMMSLVADNTALLSQFDTLDTCSNKYLEINLRDKRFKLTDGDTQPSIQEVQPIPKHESKSQTSIPSPDEPDLELAKPTRPVQFRFFMTALIAGLFIGLAITLAVLFVESQPHGLRLPTSNKIVQSLLTNYLPTAIATLIEPLWILVNRLFCMLQPLEELQGSKASASKSIDLNYSSLPPQLTIFKAFRSGHFTLATVCVMALLANVLAATFAALFFKDIESLTTQSTYLVPFETKFLSLNGSVGPQTPNNFSGAYTGGTGEDHFLVSESNYTRNTSLPGWMDDKAMYLPFSIVSDASSPQQRYRARTKYFRAEANCQALRFGQDYTFGSRDPSDSGVFLDDGDPTGDTFSPTIKGKDGRDVTCYWQDGTSKKAQFYVGWAHGWRGRCVEGKVAQEKLSPLIAGPNATEYEKETCRSAAALGWLRYETAGSRGCKEGDNTTITEENAFFMACQPKIVVGDALIVVDSDGRLLEKPKDMKPDDDQSAQALEQYFTNGAANIMAQSNSFIFRALSPGWHNHTFAGEPIHYFVSRAARTLRLTDPKEKVPGFSDIEAPMNEAYSKLFAIWLGVHKEKLFVPSSNAAKQIPGEVIYREERLFLTTSLFIIAEIILGTYVIVTVLVYFQRPGKYLPRMPTCLAAVIALFAASAAVKDLEQTSKFTTEERAAHLKELGCRYGYGSYIGGDGSVHIGVEKLPYVRHRKNTTFEYSRFDKERRRATTGLTSQMNSPVEKNAEKAWLAQITPTWFGKKRKPTFGSAKI